MTILLTGGSGFLGSYIAEQLSAAGRSVRALVRKTSDVSRLKQLPNVEIVTAAIDDRSRLLEALSGVTGIVHAAGVIKARTPAEFHETNARGTLLLVEAAKQAKQHTAPELRRFVLVSSLAAAGPSQDGTPVSTENSSGPVTDYGRSKLAGERAALAAKDDLPVTILRPPAIYGPRDKECFAFFQSVKYGVLPVMGTVNRGVSMIYVKDCAAACIAALDADVPSGSIYFLEDGVTHTLGELIAHIETAMGKRAWLRFPIPRRAMATIALGNEVYGKLRGQAVILTRDKCNELFAPHWVCDAAATRRDLDWEPKVPFPEGAKITADWYRREGWL